MGSQVENGTKQLPPTYRLEDVKIDLTRHAGVIKGSTAKIISLSGTGNATLEQSGRSLSFIYSSQDILTILNTLKSIRFFELPTQHNVKYSYYLKDDGTVSTTALSMSDTVRTTVCFSIPDYKKCVTYSPNVAPELEQLVQQIFSAANKVAK